MYTEKINIHNQDFCSILLIAPKITQTTLKQKGDYDLHHSSIFFRHHQG